MKSISVLAIPAKANKDKNPYNFILYSNLENLGIEVVEYKLKTFLKANCYDIVHIHWPENFLYTHSKAAVFKSFLFLLIKIFYIKIRGKKLIWTVHNFKPHENKNLVLMNWIYKLLFKEADGFISLTNYAAKEIVRQKNVPAHKVSVIPHPHYLNYYPNYIDKNEARIMLNIDPEKFVFLFIGQVRAYKNVIGLIKAFKELNCSNSVLLIAGKVHSEISDELEQIIKDDKSIILFPEFIKDEDLQIFLNCSDLVINPFQSILNSGSVFLNLSFSRTTLVPQNESLLELQSHVGPLWLKTYNGMLSAEHLKQTKEETANENRDGMPDLKSFSWDIIANQTKAFYHFIVG